MGRREPAVRRRREGQRRRRRPGARRPRRAPRCRAGWRRSRASWSSSTASPASTATRAVPASVTARSRWCAVMGASAQRTTVTAPVDAYHPARSGEPVQTTTPQRGSSARAAAPCAATTNRTSTCSRTPMPAAAMAAAGSSVCTWTCHVPSPPTTATESPSAAMAFRSVGPRSPSAADQQHDLVRAPRPGRSATAPPVPSGQPREQRRCPPAPPRPPARARPASRAARTPRRRRRAQHAARGARR